MGQNFSVDNTFCDKVDGLAAADGIFFVNGVALAQEFLCHLFLPDTILSVIQGIKSLRSDEC